MPESKKKTLSTCEPQAFGRNALLQKHLEQSSYKMSKEHRCLQKQLDAESEKCVISIYNLLLEAEQNEKDYKEKEKERQAKALIVETMGSVSKAYKIASRSKNKSKPRPRPVTAHAKLSTSEEGDKRPISAHASLHKAEQRTDEDDSTDSEQDSIKELPNNSRDRRVSMATLRNLEKRSSIDDKGILRPWQKVQHAVMKNSPEKSSEKSHEKASSEKVTDTFSSAYYQTGSTTKTNEVRRIFSSNVKNENRPKTAEYYRRRHPDDERSEYWNRRVNTLIRKWNVEDRGECYLDRSDIMQKSSEGPPPLIPYNPDMGESAIKVKSFLRKYANKYRALLRMSSAPPQETRVRRSEKITRQELASIHADLAKSRKNTRSILRKSKKIKQYVEQLATFYDD